MNEKKFMTFHEEVEPLSRDEKGLLKGGFVSVDLEPMPLDSKSKNKNSDQCKNTNCDAMKNKGESCTNTNCPCTCHPGDGEDGGGIMPPNYPCGGIGTLG